MNTLLNRFAWFISVSSGISISFILSSFIGFYMGGLFSAFFSLVCILIIRFGFLSESFIETRLNFFAKALEDRQEDFLQNASHTEKVLHESLEQESSYSGKDQDFIKNKLKEEDTIIALSDHQLIPQKSLVTEEYSQKEEASQESTIQETYEQIPTAFDLYLEKIQNSIKDFFTTNTLAKIGGILIFLAVIYLLKGVAGNFWEIIGPVERIIMGFAVGFIVYGVGVWLEKKGSEKEGFILIGVGILINYSVILSGRYLIGGNAFGESGFLTEGITFLLLILNSVFAVVTSLLYSSRTLLLFAFVFAYISPLIIGADSNGTPYTLVGYSLIISLAGCYLSYKHSQELELIQAYQKNNFSLLLLLSFIFGNILILIAPFSSELGWVIKSLSSLVLSGVSMFVYCKQNNSYSGIDFFIIAAYVIALLHIITLGSGIGLGEGLLTFSITLLSPVLLFLGSLFLIKRSKNTENKFMKYLLLFPLVFSLIVLLFGSGEYYMSVIIGFTLLLTLYGFSQVHTIVSSFFSKIFLSGMILFCFLSNFFFINISPEYTGIFAFQVITSFVLLFTCYYFSTHKSLEKLYAIGTIGSIFLLFPILQFDPVFTSLDLENSAPQNSVQIVLSMLSVGFFALSHWIFPFFHKKLLTKSKHLGQVIITGVLGMLFIGGELFLFLKDQDSAIQMGIAFLILALIYFLQAYFIFNKASLQTRAGSVSSSAQAINIFLSYAAMSLSIFSLAIAYIFSKYPEVISTIWLFEATILYYLYKHLSQKSQTSLLVKTALITGGNILFGIGVVKLGFLLDVVQTGDYTFLVSFGVIFASIIANTFFTDISSRERLKSSIMIHNILHIIAIGILAILLNIIIESTGNGWSLFGIAFFILILGGCYARLTSKFLPYFFIGILAFFSLYHLLSIDSVFSRLERRDTEYLKILQYISTLVIIANYFIWKHFSKLQVSKNSIAIISGIYLFLVSNIYVLDIFGGVFGNFTLTLYWGIISGFLLIYGITKDIIAYRTIGLYFILLSSAKIFFYDLWLIGNTNSRVIIFMVLGIMLVVISTLYTRKFGNNILQEISPSNLKNPLSKNTDDDQKNIMEDTEDFKDKNNEEEEEQEVEEEEQEVEEEVEEVEEEVEEVEAETTTISSEENRNITLHKKNKSLLDENLLSSHLEKIDVSNVKVVRFTPNSGIKFNIRAENLSKMAVAITEKTGKNQFKPGELLDTYNYIIEHHKTDLSRREYDKLRTAIKTFVDGGGEVEIVRV